jgi:hypothetical protein
LAANNDPIFTKVADIQFAATNPITAAMTAANITGYNGTDANAVLIYSADATNGSFVQRVRLKCGAITGTSAASVMRFWVNNGTTVGTATNNGYIGEVALPVVTYSITAATVELDYVLNLPLPPGYKLYAGLATAVTTGWHVVTIGGRY